MVSQSSSLHHSRSNLPPAGSFCTLCGNSLFGGDIALLVENLRQQSTARQRGRDVYLIHLVPRELVSTDRWFRESGPTQIQASKQTSLDLKDGSLSPVAFWELAPYLPHRTPQDLLWPLTSKIYEAPMCFFMSAEQFLYFQYPFYPQRTISLRIPFFPLLACKFKNRNSSGNIQGHVALYLDQNYKDPRGGYGLWARGETWAQHTPI